MKLQDYKQGEIHKRGGKVYYQSKSGKTVREYNSIKELLKGENGKQTNKPTRDEGEAKLVVEVNQEG